ncbi:hypothetical protein ACFPMF_12285 [Larkinella bovis]|uniref:Nucleotidyl transferase AbiEii/AbiGii toxin family protein n=1 Tax=Larkinella bovis TaxID=683041 RepID=A0ABW0IBQ5_9BACT
MDYLSTIRNVCRTFNENAVDYLIVGGTAVALHGYIRPTIGKNGQPAAKADLDFWYRTTPENHARLLKAVEQLGKDVSEHRNAEVIDLTPFLRFEFEEYTLDLLPKLKTPLRFWQAYERRQSFKSEDIDIVFISLDDLIQDKQVTGRQKDLDDIENLRRTNSS